MRIHICGAVIALAIIGCRKSEEKAETQKTVTPPSVQVLKIEPQIWRQKIRTFGVVQAAETVTLSAEFSGKVNRVFFEEGQEISAGQKMVEFDVSERRMHVKQAEGNLESAKVKLAEARTQAERREQLFMQKAISKEQLEMSRSNLASMEAQLEKLMVGRSLARHQLSRSWLISPVSGKVVTKSIEVGEVAMPGQALAVIHVTDTMRVVTYVTEEEINTVQVGAECVVTTPGVRGRQYRAHVESLGDASTQLTGNFPVKLTVENEDGLLRAGMTAIVTLKGLELKDALLIPDAAVVDRNRKKVVYLNRKGKAEAVEPVLRAATGEVLPVLHGLEQGDELIVAGLNHVMHGTPIRVSGHVKIDEILGEDVSVLAKEEEKKSEGNKGTDSVEPNGADANMRGN